MNMRSAYLFGAALAAVVAATSYASAQYRDDPPGWAFQRRGIVENLNGENPFYRRGYYYGRRYYGGPAYGWRGDYAYDPRYRYRRDWR
jgi:hypothetical protein